METFGFEAALWIWKGDAPASWHFITVPEDISAQIKFLSGTRKGFGSVRLSAKIGNTSWKTSLFPDRKSGCYLLPIKASVRKAEHLAAGGLARVVLSADL